VYRRSTEKERAAGIKCFSYNILIYACPVRPKAFYGVYPSSFSAGGHIIHFTAKAQRTQRIYKTMMGVNGKVLLVSGIKPCPYVPSGSKRGEVALTLTF